MLRVVRLFACAALLFLSGIGPVCAEEIGEVWRRPFASGVMTMAVAPADGSIWVGYDFPDPGGALKQGELLHYTADGALLGRAAKLWPFRLSVNAADGSLWVIGRDGIAHLAEDGTELWRPPDPESLRYAEALSVNAADGSCWVALDGWLEPYDDSRPYQFFNDSSVVHLSEGGEVLWRGEGFKGPYSIAVNPMDGSCFVAEQGDFSNSFMPPTWPYLAGDWVDYGIAHLAANGSRLWRHSGVGVPPTPLSLDPSDGSVWYGDLTSGEVVHLAPSGAELWRGGSFDSPEAVAAASGGGGCWGADLLWDSVSQYPSGDLVLLGADGTELWRSYPEMWSQGVTYATAIGISADPNDGSCWVHWRGSGIGARDTIVHTSRDGAELLRTSGGFEDLFDLAVNPADGSCRVLGQWHMGVGYVGSHFAEDGTELGRAELDPSPPSCVAVNPSDGSFWVAALGNVTHWAEDGSKLGPVSAGSNAKALSLNPTDGSCWAAGGESDYLSWVAHLSADGTSLWRGTGFNGPASLAVNPADGSCWVADTWNHQVVHLAADGSELWRGGQFDPLGRISVDPADGSCWVAAGDLVHLSVDGTELWRGEGLGAQAVAVDTADRSCWAIVEGGWSEEWELTCDDLVHLSQSGAELARKSGFADLVGVSVNSTDGSCWAADALRGEVVRLRPIAFADIGFDHWAFDQIRACVGNGIVGGYPDGLYHPKAAVTRDQMAVYIARMLVAPSGEAALADYVPASPRDFPDIAADSWARRHIEYCVEQNVVAGYGDGLYHPEYEVTRDQMAVYVARALAAPSGEAGLADYVPSDPRNFPDVPDSGYGDSGTDPFWAYKHIEYCVEHGVVQGYLDGNYYPYNIVTRDQMAVYVARAFLAN